MHQPEIVLAALLEAHEQFAKSVVPRCGALHHPASGGMMLSLGGRFPASPNVRGIPSGADRSVDLGGIVSFIQTQMLRCRPGRAWPLHDHAIQRVGGGPHVVAVGGGDNYRHWSAALVGQGVALGAEFGAIRGIRASRRPPNGALTITLSSACHRHWMLWRSS